MARRPSSIDKLPADVAKKLRTLLADPRVTQLEVTQRINDLLAAKGEPVQVSKSAVNRYAVRMEQAGRKIRESREVTKMWLQEYGEELEGNSGRLANELVRTIVFDLSLAIQNGRIDTENAPQIVRQVKDLALTMQRLEAAAMSNIKREQEIRAQVAAEAVEKVSEVGKRRGWSPEVLDEMRTVLGV